MLGLAGVTAMEDKGGELTVRTVVPTELLLETLPGSLEVAVMVVDPMARAVARPPLSIVATEGSEEVQVTCAVISLMLWSL
jgi:hypothetical protein